MYICDECKSKDTYVADYKYIFNINNKEYSITSKRRFCSKCNNFIYDEELDNALLKKVFRKKEEILGLEPERIIGLRKKYNLSQIEFSKIIGCAKKTLISYEKGTSIPNDAYLVTIKTLLDNPEMIRILIEANKDRYSEKEFDNINLKINKFNSKNVGKLFFNHNSSLTSYNGYSEINKDKIFNIILILSDNGIFKTKLLKEMFYCDFLYYKNNCVSLTGLEYAKINYGPVPDGYDSILSYLEQNNFIKYNIEYNDDYEAHIIYSNKKANLSLFDEEELKIINCVKEYFKNYSVNDIVNKSHNEAAFLNTEYSKLISYDYAFDIDI